MLAAEEEFFRSGYDATSTAVIAKNAGVTHAMVNYYYRSKEKIFLKVLDSCIMELLERVKPLMKAGGDFVELASETALTLYDYFLTKRKFPFLLLDVARTHPEFLEHFRETVRTVCADSIRQHSDYLKEQILEGKVADCTVNDIFDTVMSLAIAPFLNMPMLENVLGLSREQVEDYLKAHRSEMTRIILTRYRDSDRER